MAGSSRNSFMEGSSTIQELPKQHQVFINFHGPDLPRRFISYLVTALESNNVKVFVENEPLEVALKRIEESRIALVILSMKYPKSTCLEELTKIIDCEDEGNLVAIPIFYKLDRYTVSSLYGQFGDTFREMVKSNATKKKKWKIALRWISRIIGVMVHEESLEGDVIQDIVKEVKEGVYRIPLEGSQKAFVELSKSRTSLGFKKGTMEGSLRNNFVPIEGISTDEKMPRQHQVFINFRGADLPRGFISNLVTALESSNINVFVVNYLFFGEPLQVALQRIKESRIALVILSKEYSGSTNSCLEELMMIKDCVEKGNLVAIPIFYKFSRAFMDLVKNDATKKKEWEALTWISRIMGITVSVRSLQGDIIKEILKEVEEVVKNITSEGSQKAYEELPDSPNSLGFEKGKTFGSFTSSMLEEPSLQNRGTDLRYGFFSHLVKALESYKLGSQLGMIIGCLLLVSFVLQQIPYMSIGLIYQGGVMYGIVENVQKALEYIPIEGTKNLRDKYIKFPTRDVGAKPGSSTSDAKMNANFFDRTFTSPIDRKVKPPQIQVFINFRGEQLRYNFVGYLVDALQRSEINVFIDNQALRGEDLNSLFKRIEDSGIAIVVFSSRYTESTWCLEELVKIKERVHQGHLKVLPIFYKVSPTNVKRLKGDFGDHFRDKEYTYESDEPMIKRWKEAITYVSHKFALTLDEKSEFVRMIITRSRENGTTTREFCGQSISRKKKPYFFSWKAMYEHPRKEFVFLNLSGMHKSLASTEDEYRSSLRTLILSGCSNLRKFWLISRVSNCFRVLNLIVCEEVQLAGESYRVYCQAKVPYIRIDSVWLFKSQNFQVLLLDGTSIEEVPKILLHGNNNLSSLSPYKPAQFPTYLGGGTVDALPTKTPIIIYLGQFNLLQL